MQFTPHPKLHTPADDQTLWRYMGMGALISLLTRKKLYMRRVDQFRDPYEGHITGVTINRYREIEEKFIALKLDDSPRTREIIRNIERDTRQIGALAKTWNFVSCWHANNFESAAMWDLYSKNQGIGIRTNFKKIKESLTSDGKNSDKDFVAGYIQYCDYNVPQLSDAMNFLLPAFRKRLSFEHEKEVRVAFINKENLTIKNDSAYPLGIEVDVSPDKLIESLFLAPDSPNWLAESITSLIQSLGYSFPVQVSSLYDPV